MSVGVGLFLCLLESRAPTPTHCLSIYHESNPCGPVSFDLTKLQRLAPRPVTTRRVWDALSHKNATHTSRLSHPKSDSIKGVRKTQKIKKNQDFTKQIVAVMGTGHDLEGGVTGALISASFLSLSATYFTLNSCFLLQRRKETPQ